MGGRLPPKIHKWFRQLLTRNGLKRFKKNANRVAFSLSIKARLGAQPFIFIHMQNLERFRTQRVHDVTVTYHVILRRHSWIAPQVEDEQAEALRVMAAALKFALIASSLVAVSNGYCDSVYSTACGVDQVCCNHECVFGSDCTGYACSTDSDCAMSCCNGYCENNCAGYSCSVDSDCGSFGSCCDGTCSSEYEDCFYDPTAVIVGSIFGTIIFFCMVSMCIYACRRRRIVRHGRVIVGQTVTATTITTTGTVQQANPPYHWQMPPSYQQGYPYHPPPQYEQYQVAAPPPYNPGTARGSEQPPPYSATTHGKSGGVYTPQTSYGAVQTPSAQPV